MPRTSVNPPSPFVEEFAGNLEYDVQYTILDLGCATGRNSLHLASLGHTVVGACADLLDLKIASKLAAETDFNRGRCDFVACDARQPAFGNKFDVVLINEMLHMMPKSQATDVLANAQALTVRGGLNVISGYVVDPWNTNGRNRARCFWPGELQEMYRSPGWQLLSYSEDVFQKQVVGQQELIGSLAKLIAVRTNA